MNVHYSYNLNGTNGHSHIFGVLCLLAKLVVFVWTKAFVETVMNTVDNIMLSFAYYENC